MCSAVTVLGLGEMGSALAAALVRSGREVTVWNRSPARAAPLTDAGAKLADSVAEAVAASPVVVICVSDYAATRQLIDAAQVQPGTVFVQLSTGTPGEARELAEVVRGLGAAYLDGAIFAWPRQIGGPEAVIAVAGDESLYEATTAIWQDLAGTVIHQGVPIGSAAALFASTLAYLAGHWIGFAHGAGIAQSEGLDAEEFGQLVKSLSPVLGADAAHMGAVVQHQRYANPESTLGTVANDLRGLVRQAADAGIGADFPLFAADLFERAVKAGLGAEEHVALIKVLWAQDTSG
ncbi:NAD(P)-dependent oxidoreductase [Kribbella deserti]|uniref:NAD(P)-dependent oxidoreductase n=1 Tax=Kribbella deserti TaxID=1926257 RepID=A0ABV6QFR4_9ACTN